MRRILEAVECAGAANISCANVVFGSDCELFYDEELNALDN
jgi:hypothetical protein